MPNAFRNLLPAGSVCRRGSDTGTYNGCVELVPAWYDPASCPGYAGGEVAGISVSSSSLLACGGTFGVCGVSSGIIILGKRGVVVVRDEG